MLLLKRRDFEQPIRAATKTVRRTVRAALRQLHGPCNTKGMAGLMPVLMAMAAVLGQRLALPPGSRPAKFKKLLVPDDPNYMPDFSTWRVQGICDHQQMQTFRLNETPVPFWGTFSHHFGPIHSCLQFCEFLLVDDISVPLPMPDDGDEIEHMCHRLMWLARRVAPTADLSAQALRDAGASNRGLIQLSTNCFRKHEKFDRQINHDNPSPKEPLTLVSVAWSMGLALASFATRIACLLSPNSESEILLRLGIGMARQCCNLSDGAKAFDHAWAAYSTGHAAWHLISAVAGLSHRVRLEGQADSRIIPTMREHAKKRQKSLHHSLRPSFAPLHQSVSERLKSGEASDLMNAELTLVAFEAYDQAATALTAVDCEVPV